LSSVNTVAFNNSNLFNVSAVNPVEEGLGTIIELNQTGGKLIDHVTGSNF
jgi:hypothetical protein